MEQMLTKFSAGLADAVEKAAAFAVGVEARPRMGSSGILWQSGVIVTADHTIRREEEIPVILPDGSLTRAEFAGRDAGTDLAVLRIPESSTPSFERAGQLRTGELVISVGRHQPGALAGLGLVSTAGGPWKTWRGGQLESLIRLDISAYPRSSGSVVIDTAGRVVGLLTSGLTRTAPVAIPASTIDRVVGELLEHGRIARGYLGVGLQPIPLPAQLAAVLGREQRSALIVLSVEPNGPAEQGGVLLGDILVQLGGQPVTDTDEVQAALQSSIAKPVDAVVFRAGKRADLQVTVGERRS